MLGGNPCAWSLQRIALKLTNSRKCSSKIQPAMTCPIGILSSIELIGHWQERYSPNAKDAQQLSEKEIWNLQPLNYASDPWFVLNLYHWENINLLSYYCFSVVLWLCKSHMY